MCSHSRLIPFCVHINSIFPLQDLPLLVALLLGGPLLLPAAVAPLEVLAFSLALLPALALLPELLLALLPELLLALRQPVAAATRRMLDGFILYSLHLFGMFLCARGSAFHLLPSHCLAPACLAPPLLLVLELLAYTCFQCHVHLINNKSI